MGTSESGQRDTFALEPKGQDLRPGLLGTLAQTGGTLVGAIVDGRVRTWLADTAGHLTLVMWPGNFTARFNPLEIVNGDSQTIARGGRVVLLGGGYLKTADPRLLGHKEAFSAWTASEADSPIHGERRPSSAKADVSRGDR